MVSQLARMQSNANANPKFYAHTNTYTDAYANANANPHTNTYTYTDPHADAQSQPHADIIARKPASSLGN